MDSPESQWPSSSLEHLATHGADVGQVTAAIISAWSGSSHSNELREYTIDGSGIQIGEMLPNQEGLLGGGPTRRERGKSSAPDKRGRPS